MNTRFKLIGLCGKIGAGKSTAAAYLSAHHGYTEFSFAGPLKAVCSELLGLPREYFSARDLKEAPLTWPIGHTPRSVLQVLGTDLIRNTFGQDFWIRRMEQEIRSSDPELVVISDVRFQNEAEWIIYNGGHVLEIFNPHLTSQGTHISETSLDLTKLPTERTHRIWNDHTKAHLFSQLSSLVN